MIYVALLRKEPTSDYAVDFPDFPGCVTAGKSPAEAQRMAIEALELHIEGMLEDAEPLPKPLTLNSVMTESRNRSAVAFLVEAAKSKLANTG